MNPRTFLQAFAVCSFFVLMLSACRPYRHTTVYRTAEPQVVVVKEKPDVIVKEQQKVVTTEPAPAVKKRTALIIVRQTTQEIKQYTDGRMYLKSAEGYFYWKGFDHRWYMDENDLKKVLYTDEEYIEWTRKGRSRDYNSNNRNNDNSNRGNGNRGNGNGNWSEKEMKEKKEKEEKEKKDKEEKEKKDKKEKEEKEIGRAHV